MELHSPSIIILDVLGCLELESSAPYFAKGGRVDGQVAEESGHDQGLEARFQAKA